MNQTKTTKARFWLSAPGVLGCFVALGALFNSVHAGDLFEAVMRSNAVAIRELVQRGADPNVSNRDGKVPLHLAVENGNAAAAKALMASGADATIRNLEGFSPFFVASVVKQDLGLTAILMKTNDNSSRAKPFPLADFGSEPPVAKRFTDTASLIQWNARFGYRFIASPDWELNGFQQDGVFQRQSIVVLTLPAVWSEREQQTIKNAISLYAKEDGDVRSLTNAVDAFWREVTAEGGVTNRREVLSDSERYVVDFNHTDHGLVYRRRSQVLFRNGVGYRLNFIATAGTFEKNVAVFSAFCNSIKFLVPEGRATKKKGDQPNGAANQ